MGEKETNRSHGIGFTVLVSALTFVFLSLIVMCFVVHMTPVLGCSVVPTIKNVDGLELSSYVVKSGSGEHYTILFFKNTADGTIRVNSTNRKSVEGVRELTQLMPGEEGMSLMSDELGTEDIRAAERKNAKGWSDGLSWRIDDTGNGYKYLVIENTSGESIPIQCGPTLASRGMTAGVIDLHGAFGQSVLDQGEARFNLQHVYNGLCVGDDVPISDDIELYVNGAKAPHA